MSRRSCLLAALALLLGGCAADSEWRETNLFEQPQGELRMLHCPGAQALYAYGEQGLPTLAPHEGRPFLREASTTHLGSGWEPVYYYNRDDAPRIGCLAADPSGVTLLAGGEEGGVLLGGRGTSQWKPLSGLPVGFRAALVAFAGPAAVARLLVVGEGGRIFVSEDQGGAWQEASGAEGLPASLAVGASGCWYQTDQGLYRSQDAGRTWVKAGDLPGVPGAGAIVLAPSETETVFVVSKQGTTQVYRSDEGTTWTPVPGSESARDLVVDPADPRRLFLACGQAPTVRLSRDGGQTWQPLAERVPARQLVLLEHELLAAESLSTTWRALSLSELR